MDTLIETDQDELEKSQKNEVRLGRKRMLSEMDFDNEDVPNGYTRVGINGTDSRYVVKGSQYARDLLEG